MNKNSFLIVHSNSSRGWGVTKRGRVFPGGPAIREVKGWPWRLGLIRNIGGKEKGGKGQGRGGGERTCGARGMWVRGVLRAGRGHGLQPINSEHPEPDCQQ